MNEPHNEMPGVYVSFEDMQQFVAQSERIAELEKRVDGADAVGFRRGVMQAREELEAELKEVKSKITEYALEDDENQRQLANVLAENKELRIKNEKYKQLHTDFLTRSPLPKVIMELEAENKRLQELAKVRGERMEVLFDTFNDTEPTIKRLRDINSWFDEQGRVK